MTTTPASRPSTVQRLRLPVLTAYLWVMTVLLGAIVLETLMVYPNVFADPPGSLGLTMEFLSVTGPSDFFPPLGFASWVLGAAAVLLCWRQRDARRWTLLSVVMIVCEGVASMLYFWPRNDIMFVEGLEVHSAEYLVQVAQEFETWHWASRMGFNVVAAVAAFLAFLAVYRAHVARRLPAAVPAAVAA
ncbi:hypothetical protein [Georgenia sp. H159]|uniref:hypothetical protein n=1 Tax=Georgenia sp. H159 TaxID=3076115 RepID=UPI002D78EA47|nr:hypothetical protein [Georgenia sp. H159]